MDGARILLVEDDERLAQLVADALARAGWQVTHCARGDEGEARMRREPYDVVLLDGHLPGKDGFDVCREVRVRYPGVILMLTARDDDVEQVLGLGLGADDYLLKPATPHVVLAHLRACMRRLHDEPAKGPDEYHFGRFSISCATRRALLDEAEVEFSTAEFDLLWLLVSQAGTVLSRDGINNALRGLEHDGQNRSIDMRVSRLRKALGDDAERPVRIKTVRGKGYLFSRTDWS